MCVFACVGLCEILFSIEAVVSIEVHMCVCALALMPKDLFMITESCGFHIHNMLTVSVFIACFTFVNTSVRLILCRMKSRVAHRIKQLEALVDTLSDHLRVKAMVELRALRLIGYQSQVCTYNNVTNTLYVIIFYWLVGMPQIRATPFSDSTIPFCG